MGVLGKGALPTNESDLFAKNPLLSKKRKRSESGKKRVNVLLILEIPVAPNDKDPEALAVGEDEEGPLVPEEVGESLWKVMDFPTWFVSFKRKRSSQGKRIDYGGAVADPFWTKTTL